MTDQEVLWKGKLVWVTGMMSKSGVMHLYVRRFVGLRGLVVAEAKNGMLRIEFKNQGRYKNHTRNIPAGCVVDYDRCKVLVK